MGAAAILAACTGQQTTPAVENVSQDERFGVASNESETIGDLVAFNREGGPVGQSIPVNKYLWRGALETLDFMPLNSTDPFSGVIATDWATSVDAPDERFKVTVYISDALLEARSLNVAVYREVRADSGPWAPAEVSEATPRQLEDAILTRARQLRVDDLTRERN